MEQKKVEIDIDIFSRPLMQQAALELVTLEAQHEYDLVFLKRKSTYSKNLNYYLIEQELVAMGVYKDIEEAKKGAFCFDLDEENATLEILGEDEEEILREIPFVEYPALNAIFMTAKAEVEEMKADAKARQKTYRENFEQTWGKIYTDLVALGHYTSVEEASKDKFTIKDGRWLVNRELPRSMAEMLSQVFG
jgi:hypothetical protein